MSPWFPLFGRDFLAGTLGWTAEERGHYAVLLIAQWEQGGLPDDPKRLELISPGIRSAWKTVSEKFPVWQDGKRRNTRLEHERSKATERSERARQSASQRWASEASLGGDRKAPEPTQTAQPAEPEGCDRISDRICDRISDRICPDDASMSMLNSPPPPDANSSGWEQSWPILRAAWNAGDGRHRKPWRSESPPPEARERLTEEGWLDEALRAIEYLPRCRRFTTAVSLRQILKPGWVSKILGGDFDDQLRQEPSRSAPRGPDERPPAQGWSGADLEAYRRTQAKLLREAAG